LLLAVGFACFAYLSTRSKAFEKTPGVPFSTTRTEPQFKGPLPVPMFQDSRSSLLVAFCSAAAAFLVLLIVQ